MRVAARRRRGELYNARSLFAPPISERPPPALPPTMSPLGISLLMLVAAVAFAWLAWRKLAIVAALAPRSALGPSAGAREERGHQRLPAVAHDPARLEARRDARGDLRRLHDAAGAQAAADRHRLRASRSPTPGLGGAFFAAFKDVVEIGVLAALGYAFWRRFVQRPRRLEAQPRGAADPDADRRDHGDGLRVRRVPVRAAFRRPTPASRTNARTRSSAAASPTPSGLVAARADAPATTRLLGADRRRASPSS